MVIVAVNAYYNKKEHGVAIATTNLFFGHLKVIRDCKVATKAKAIKETGRKVPGVSSGQRKENKETWWWED